MEFGLIGEKLNHSFSPQIYQLLGVPDYRLCPLSPEELPPFLKKGDFQGVNVTIPYKQAVIPFCQELSPQALRIGSVNTLVRRSDGSLLGDNSDYHGFVALVERAKVDLAGKKVMVLGSGGTSLTVQAVAEDYKAASVVVVSRQGPITYNHLEAHRDAQIIVNTTPVGMWPNCPQQPLDLSIFSHLHGVLDVIYNPLKTALILNAKERGIPACGGLSMLVAQAWAAAQHFLKRNIPQEVTWEILTKLTNQRRNIVLFGMPGSGKTTIGKALAIALCRPFVDTDYEVEKDAGCTVSQIFAQEGEAGFRTRETKAIIRCGSGTGAVISIGGGGALSSQNRQVLLQNGIPVLLERPLKELQIGKNRPLSYSREAVETLWEKRMPLYQAFAHIRIANTGTVEETVAKIRMECGV